MPVTSRIETITPAKAAEYLKLNTKNRPLKRVVDEMVRDMLAGRWQLNGESIKTAYTNGSNKDDRLADGQNRLTAVVQSGVTIQSLVVHGLPWEETITTIDAGAKRTMGDVLKLTRDEKHYSALSGALSWAYRQEHRKGKDRGFTGSHNELIAYLDTNPNIREAVELATHARSHFPLLRPAPFAATLFHGFGVSEPITRTFAEQVANGEGLRPAQPALTLREWCTRAAAAARQPVVDAYPAVYNKALIAELEGRDLGRLHYRAEQAFPYVQDAEIIEAG